MVNRFFLNSKFYTQFKMVIVQLRPKPFQQLQKFLNIQNEWQQFKQLSKPYNKKIAFTFSVIAIPLFQSSFEQILNKIIEKFQKNQLQKGKPIEKITEQYVNLIVQEVLKDHQIRREGALFVENLAKKQLVHEAVVKLLTDCCQDPKFVKQSNILLKSIVQSILQDKQIEQDACDLVIRTFKDPEVKQELIDVSKYLAQNNEMIHSIAQLFIYAFQDPKLQIALQGALQESFNHIIMDQQTVEKLKMFSYFLIEAESGEEGSIQNLIDMIADKVVRTKQQNSKQTEFEKIINNSQQELNKQPNSDNDKKRFYFF